MNNNMELSFKMSDEEIEKIKKILCTGGIRHYLLKIVDDEEIDVVEYKEYQKLEKELEQLKEIEKEHQRINGELRVENKELKYKINNLILFAYGTEMSLGEFKGIFKLAFDKEHNPKIPIEKQVGGKQ